MSELDPERLPRHVAIIMDGNGRWARRRGLPRFYGHREGVKVVKRIITKACEIPIPVLTLYAFSRENWERPQEEIMVLMELLRTYLREELPEMKTRGIRFKVIGERERFPSDIQEMIARCEEETASCSRMTLVLALSYGGRAEIVRAVRLLAEEVKAGKVSPEAITPETFARYLYTADLPDPDLLIRTSGEQRISNFLLYQCAYTEFYFTPVLWPDFTEEEFLKALRDYQRRERRFGRV
ncbi:isoprenyl transferase [Thermosulfurimonas dismutans]|uniref:Isoprenyl transferase n=1 Tax=Thermosulfurimonas dismutans TaxID=999894 RepID=A0A179D4Y7_9BACT|nr:isoprenyl transferase [Thermosulfurimonas dismutans]OAQ21145.1 Undecaprenyl pyrophosphate synthetase [Thermosulfurimonas dismutans]